MKPSQEIVRKVNSGNIQGDIHSQEIHSANKKKMWSSPVSFGIPETKQYDFKTDS